MKCFLNDLYDYDYTGEQAENNQEEWWRWRNQYKVNRRGERNKWNLRKYYWKRLIVCVSTFISNSTWFEKRDVFH